MRCLADLLANDQPLQLDPLAVRRAHLPPALGGLGFRSATAGRWAPYWASWADTLFPRCTGGAHRLWRMLAIGMTTPFYSLLALQHSLGRHPSCESRVSPRRRGQKSPLAGGPPPTGAAANLVIHSRDGSVQFGQDSA